MCIRDRPWPENLDFAAKVEAVVRAEGAVPALSLIHIWRRA